MKYEFWIPTIISVVSIVWNFFQSQKLLRLQVNAEAKKTIHKFQFEKEFQIYGELWKKLVNLSYATFELRAKFSIDLEEKHISEVRIERSQAFRKAFKEVLETFDQYRPFYSKDIYNEIKKLLYLSNVEGLEYYTQNSNNESYWQRGADNAAKVDRYIDDICILIRKRIEIIEHL